jgi:tRNA pseudouridine38-40 synthase
VGKGKEPPGWPADVLAMKDRTKAGMTAPPQGLFLLWVEYPEILESELPLLDSTEESVLE